ncbi:uncharacterized protein [Amphiura filiformis]|uniref:uncharacterized protein n=1 Tax=Amphiura filiformis TaxID=82378 RepID=UPI003B212182
MKYFTITHVSWVFVMILDYHICTSAKSRWFKQLSRKEISTTSHWIPQSDWFQMKNCGPPFSFSVTPWPIQLNGETRLELNFTAAHTLIAGDLVVNLNQWPYNFVLDFCDYTLDRKVPWCPIKKGETYSFYAKDTVSSIAVFPYKGHFVGNATVSNSNDDVLLCFSLDVKLP